MKDSLFQHAVDFIFDHFLDITIVVLFIGIYSSFVILNGLVERKSKPKLKRVVVIENLSNNSDMKSAMQNGFCKSTLSDNNKREENCKKLSQDNCNAVECCIYAKQPNREHGSDIFTCVAGDKQGPTFISKPPVDEYYYLGKLKKKGQNK